MPSQKNYEEEKKLHQEHERTIKLLIQRDIELRAINDRLEHMVQEKSDFVSVAAHELRTPLTAIKWITQLLRKDTLGTLNQEQAEQIAKLNAIIDKMVSLVNDILNVTRIEEGRFGLELERKDPLAMLQRVLATAEINAQAKGVNLVKIIPSSLPILAFDEERLALALDNVVSNAIKYTPSGGSVTATVAADEKQIIIIITDTGIGIAPEEQERLFSKFFRANNALKLDTEGTGLGLFITRNIIETHKGSITFVSELNKSTSFTITLPIANSAA